MIKTSCSTGGKARQRATDNPKLHTSYLNDEMRVKLTVLVFWPAKLHIHQYSQMVVESPGNNISAIHLPITIHEVLHAGAKIETHVRQDDCTKR